MTFDNFPTNTIEFERRFSSESACWEYLCSMKWPSGFHCPRCSGKYSYFVIDRGLDECASCGKQTSVTAGTMFHRTRSPLTTWFRVIFEFISSKNGCSAMHIMRTVGISFETAWMWLHKIRDVMTRHGRSPLSGSVEFDEAYIGGPAPGHPGRSLGRNQFALAVAVERRGDASGRARLMPVSDVSGPDLVPKVESSVQQGAVLITDGFASYQTLGPDFDHRAIVLRDARNASRFQPRVHRVISLFKRVLITTYQGSVSRKWSALYCEEFVFRYNRRTTAPRTQLFLRVIQQTVKRAPRIHRLTWRKRLVHVVPEAGLTPISPIQILRFQRLRGLRLRDCEPRSAVASYNWN